MNAVSLHPPKPHLVLRVGVTGHRHLLAEHVECVREQTRAVLKALHDQVHDLVKRTEIAAVYHNGPPLLRIVSPLAEGADRLVAGEGLALGYELQCPMPFFQPEYEQDFEMPGSLEEFRKLLGRASAILELDGDRADADTAYLTVGRMVMRHSDVLIALWDGDPAAGKGGTGDIVDEALAAGRGLIVHIDTEGRHDPCWIRLNTNSQKEQLTVVPQLLDHLQHILAPPVHLKNDSIGAKYRDEEWPRRLWPAFQWFESWLGRRQLRKPTSRIPDPDTAATGMWRALNHAIGLPINVAEQVDRDYLRHFAWTDQLANYYAHKHRSAFLLIYGLAALAVLLAVASYVFREQARVLAGAELISIVLMFGLYQLGRRRRWHERWIDYRLVAEWLRHLQFLAPVGHTVPVYLPPAHHRLDDPTNTWVDWLFQAIVRAGSLPGARFNAEYLEAARGLMVFRDPSRSSADPQGMLCGQVVYHRDTAQRCKRIAQCLHGLILWVLLPSVVLAGLAHILIHGPTVERIATLVATFFPALGAAVEGILNQGEFERIERRSQAMSAQLQKLVVRIDGLGLPLQSARLARLAEEASETMISESLDWRVVLRARPLHSPL